MFEEHVLQRLWDGKGTEMDKIKQSQLTEGLKLARNLAGPVLEGRLCRRALQRVGALLASPPAHGRLFQLITFPPLRPSERAWRRKGCGDGRFLQRAQRLSLKVPPKHLDFLFLGSSHRFCQSHVPCSPYPSAWSLENTTVSSYQSSYSLP